MKQKHAAIITAENIGNASTVAELDRIQRGDFEAFPPQIRVILMDLVLERYNKISYGACDDVKVKRLNKQLGELIS